MTTDAVLDPWTGAQVWSRDPSSPDEIEAAISAADAEFIRWRARPAWERAAALRASADAIAAAADDLVGLLVRTIGKPRRAAKTEVRRTADMLRMCSESAAQLSGETLPVDSTPGGEGHWSVTFREPYGVAALITPFNAPLNLLMQKLAPALAAGNSAVVKPSREGAAVTEELVRLIAAELPDDLVQLVHGGPQEALSVVADERVRVVSLTGGTVAGQAVLAAAGIKPVHLELGSNSPNIVLADADVSRAAAQIARAGFEASGQQCISAQRVLVADTIKDQFVSELVAAASAMTVGDPSAEETDIGPVVHSSSAHRIVDMIADAEQRGAHVALDGRSFATSNVRLLGPTILVDPPSAAAVMCSEAFGPVVAVVSVADLDEAITVANSVPGLLQASCFTGDLSAAVRAAHDLWAGSVWINETTRFRLDVHPFGGTGTSGLGREGLRYAMEAFTQIKHVGIRTT